MESLSSKLGHTGYALYGTVTVRIRLSQRIRLYGTVRGSLRTRTTVSSSVFPEGQKLFRQPPIRSLVDQPLFVQSISQVPVRGLAFEDKPSVLREWNPFLRV